MTTESGVCAIPVQKGFVDASGCRLHYVRQGQGPAVVLLHASPCSAKVMAPLQASWGREFTTFAFDLPGFGLSQAPADGEITIESLADLIASGMRALGIANAALYGRHTGASICLEIALRHPDLAAMLLTDGLPIFAAPYTEERLAQYLPPITPRWDGGHLTWAYFRYREQHVFWPWDHADLAHRADADIPDADFLHRGALELLESASTYARTYRAAFLHRTLPLIEKVRIPAYWGNRPGDSQFKTVERYPKNAAVRLMSREPDIAADEELALLRRHKASGAVPPRRSRFTLDAPPAELVDYIPTRHGDVRAIGKSLDSRAAPVLFLHDIPGGIDLHETEIAELARARPVLAFDLAGNAESAAAGKPDHGVWLEQIEDVLNAVGWDKVDIHAQGTSAYLALAYGRANPGRVGSIALVSPPLFAARERQTLAGRYAPDISPTEDGGYLLRLWHHLRDQELWYPWFERSHAARKSTEPRIDPAWLTRRAVALLKQPRLYAGLWREVLAADVPALLEGHPLPVHISARPSDVFAPSVQHHQI